MQNYLSSVGSTLVTSFHFHTYGQLWLIPWGSVDILGNCNFADDHAELVSQYQNDKWSSRTGKSRKISGLDKTGKSHGAGKSIPEFFLASNSQNN